MEGDRWRTGWWVEGADSIAFETLRSEDRRLSGQSRRDRAAMSHHGSVLFGESSVKAS